LLAKIAISRKFPPTFQQQIPDHSSCFISAGDWYCESFFVNNLDELRRYLLQDGQGAAEIKSRSQGLSMQHRRALILANGSNDVAELKRLSAHENATDILLSLVANGFIQAGSDASPGQATAAQDYAIAKSSP
jgi:hypothetical protein